MFAAIYNGSIKEFTGHLYLWAMEPTSNRYWGIPVNNPDLPDLRHTRGESINRDPVCQDPDSWPVTEHPADRVRRLTGPTEAEQDKATEDAWKEHYTPEIADAMAGHP